ncbi:uncharacterized protein LOC119360837 [Triticum dicoccoides]|uniref:uncharacterized protein LOC119360837 n=1 Tax=Triticum dicoccoides TaxID=85692 RepID=UPI00188EB9AA|nr:uncharacterized protein LOC119360837 [Triticum dicoccoides]
MSELVVSPYSYLIPSLVCIAHRPRIAHLSQRTWAGPLTRSLAQALDARSSQCLHSSRPRAAVLFFSPISSPCPTPRRPGTWPTPATPRDPAAPPPPSHPRRRGAGLNSIADLLALPAAAAVTSEAVRSRPDLDPPRPLHPYERHEHHPSSSHQRDAATIFQPPGTIGTGPAAPADDLGDSSRMAVDRCGTFLVALGFDPTSPWGVTSLKENLK